MKNSILTFLIIIIPILSWGQENEITFKVCDVEENNSRINTMPYFSALELRIKDFENKIESYNIEGDKQEMISCNYHPFMEALYFSFAEHRNITISPDMIWLLICQGFAKHVDMNAEELRYKFVSHEGKVDIVITRNSFTKGKQNPWENTFPEFCDSIENYVGEELTNLVIADFSTTGAAETAAFQLSLMDAMDNYFRYTMMTLCGIPSINLTGSTEDWQWILDNIEKFNEYDLEWWTSNLKPVLQEFVDASKGDVDTKFWQGMYKYIPAGGGSGGVPHINGWVIKFFPYIHTYENEFEKNPYMNNDLHPKEEKLKEKKEGEIVVLIPKNEGLEIPDFPSGYSKVDFTWNYYSTEYKMHFIAGFLGIVQDENGFLIPEITWIVKEQ